MTKEQKKAALANYVAGLTPEAIAAALSLPIEDVRAALKVEPAEHEPAAAVAPAPAPTTTPEGSRHVRIGAGYGRLFGQGCATIGGGGRVPIGGRRDGRKL